MVSFQEEWKTKYRGKSRAFKWPLAGQTSRQVPGIRRRATGNAFISQGKAFRNLGGKRRFKRFSCKYFKK